MTNLFCPYTAEQLVPSKPTVAYPLMVPVPEWGSYMGPTVPDGPNCRLTNTKQRGAHSGVYCIPTVSVAQKGFVDSLQLITTDQPLSHRVQPFLLLPKILNQENISLLVLNIRLFWSPIQNTVYLLSSFQMVDSVHCTTLDVQLLNST